MKKIKSSLVFFQTLLAFVLTHGLVIHAVYTFRNLVQEGVAYPGGMIDAKQLLITFMFTTLLLLYLLKKLRKPIIFEVIFGISIFLGMWSLFSVYSASAAFMIAIIILATRYMFPVVIVQNVVLVLGIAGIAVAIGGAMTWQSMVVVLAFLSLYDVVAVYATKHMVVMFSKLVNQGVVFALIIPTNLKLLLAKITKQTPGKEFLFLGSGDIAIPALFVASATRYSIWLAMGAAVGSLIGLLGTNLLFKLGKGHPLPALPAIAIGTLLGFFIVKLII